MDNVCRYLKESSKGPESEWEYNIEVVCECQANGDTMLDTDCYFAGFKISAAKQLRTALFWVITYYFWILEP